MPDGKFIIRIEPWAISVEYSIDVYPFVSKFGAIEFFCYESQIIAGLNYINFGLDPGGNGGLMLRPQCFCFFHNETLLFGRLGLTASGAKA